MTTGHAIDMDLYSRQIGTLGFEAMCRLTALSAFVSGMNGTGVETAKNLVLGGPKQVTIHDDTAVCISDLNSNCYLEPSHVGQTRAAVCVPKLQELNSYVAVSQHIGQVTPSVVAQHDVVVAVDYDKVALEQLSLLCREQKVKFIAVNSFGLCASVFVDFGDQHQVHDVDGEEPKSLVVSHIALQDDCMNIQCTDDKKIPFDDRGTVCLKDIQIARNVIADSAELVRLNDVPLVIQKLHTYSMDLAYPPGFIVPHTRGIIPVSAHVTSLKSGRNLHFKSYSEACSQPVAEGESALTTVDYAKMGRAEQLHICTQALLQSVLQLGNRLPDVRKDFDKLLSIAKSLNENYKKLAAEGTVRVDEIDQDVLRHICRFAGVVLSPLSVILGGIVAQEIVKATGKYMPIHQWLYLDCFELVDGIDYDKDPQNFEPVGSRYDDNIQLWGKANQRLLADAQLFLVGTGALGCEYLKNFALLGLCTGDRAKLTLTDMDRIEVSNLNRQFLFRKQHVGMSKSMTARAAIKTVNPQMHVEALETRVGAETEDTVFTEEFWEGLDIVVNALDNVPSRLYIDGKCVWHMKPLIESGTLGTKGNVQVIVPGLTQSYGDSRDPPDEAIPLCTLRLFPNMIDHTMEWARDLFQGYLTGAVQEAVSVIKTHGQILGALRAEGGPQVVETLEKIDNLLALIAPDRDVCLRRCVQLAVRLFQKLFHDDVAQLLYNFPIDHLNNDGTPFWIGSKRPPTPLVWDVNDELHLDFVEACARLYFFVVNNGATDAGASRADIKRLAEGVVPPAFQPRKMNIKTTDEELADTAAPDMDELMVSRQEQLQQKVTAAVSTLPPATALMPVEFEKEDDTNFHIQFISAAGNLRARNYKIPEIERWRAKLIAGKIIPAIATTTAMVTGFATLELIKVLLRRNPEDRKIEVYKDLFANLSLPLWLLSEPMPPKVMKSVDYDPIVGGPVRCKPAEFSPWDKVVVDLTTAGRSGTMQDLITELENKFQTEVTILSAGNVCLYMSYSRSNKLGERMRDVIAQAAAATENSDLSVKQGYCVIQVCCTDKDGVDVNIPVVKCIY